MCAPRGGLSIHYVVKGDDTTLKCRDYDDNGQFRGFISNAHWYRTYSNGSSYVIGSSGQVAAYSYTLIFKKIKEADQGNYTCCTPQKDCSKPTFVAIAGKSINIKVTPLTIAIAIAS